MNTHDKESGGLTLMEAVDALSTIAETHWERESPTVEPMIDEIDFKKASWLRGSDKQQTLHVVKDIFKVILNHFKNFYQNENTFVTDSKKLEGIKTIMVIVGEAAKKIDRFTNLFKDSRPESVTGLREYKQLQEFYKRKISRTIDEATLGKWILGLTQRTFQEHSIKHVEGIRSLETRHVFVDLDSVKKDTEYELFFIRKEDGTRFFSPRLIRNIKLVCDFGAHIGQAKERDPLTDKAIWEDRYGYGQARNLLTLVMPVLKRYHPAIVRNKQHEFAATLNKAIIALLLASSKTRLNVAGASKTCKEYWSDFQVFFREVLVSREFQKLNAFPAEKLNEVDTAASRIINAILRALFEEGRSVTDIRSYLHFLMNESSEAISIDHRREAEKCGMIWSKLAAEYSAFQKFMTHHMSGPLDKVLTLLEDGNFQVYDPYMLNQTPELLFNIYDKKRKVSLIALPSPTVQEFIQNAKVNEEFLSYLRASHTDHAPILLINYQDRTSWREHARAHEVEGLEEASAFQGQLTVVSLPRDTEFYRQDAPYHEDHQAAVFKKHLQAHMADNQSGFYMSDKLRKVITPAWIEGVFNAINRIFFSGKNVIPRESRLEFIELFYLFFTLKVIEIVKAEKVFLCCKDGVDVTPAAACELFLALKLFNGEVLTASDHQSVQEMLYGSALINRERVLLADRFHRMLNMVKLIENVQQELGSVGFDKLIHEGFGRYFNEGIIQSLPSFPKKIKEHA